jgi:hypothetical protein
MSYMQVSGELSLAMFIRVCGVFLLISMQRKAFYAQCTGYISGYVTKPVSTSSIALFGYQRGDHQIEPPRCKQRSAYF